MNIPSFQKTKRIFIASLVGSLAIGALYGAFFYYIRNLNSEVALLKTEVIKFKSEEKDRIIAEKTFQETFDNRNRVNSFFVGPSEEEEVDFVSSLENMATGTGKKINLEISNLRHEQLLGIKSDKVEYLVLQANVRGSFAEVFNFLKLLEVFPKGVALSQVDMEAISGDPKKAREWRLAFVLQVLKVK